MSKRRVDHAYIADLVARHGGDRYTVARRYVQYVGLGTLDLLKIQREAVRRVVCEGCGCVWALDPNENMTTCETCGKQVSSST